MWQGIGPPLELERLGIGVKAALRGVGENLQDHLQIRTVFKCSAQTLNDQVALPCPALPCPALPCPALPCPARLHPQPYVLAACECRRRHDITVVCYDMPTSHRIHSARRTC